MLSDLPVWGRWTVHAKGEGYELVFWNGARGIRARLSTAERATALGGERGLTKALVKNT
jgi:hypothetical protein